MATTVQNQVASINACAAHFALRNYHVETNFYSNSAGCTCTIFFHDVKRRHRISRILRCFADEGDTIKFNAFEGFNTLSLQKI